ncbi:MAG: agmatinase [Parcubacteria group bacterium Gr01-1014_48]|nr:MAG: agmatinase [Parcubacteria group bacterium Gr01-1014_48]
MSTKHKGEQVTQSVPSIIYSMVVPGVDVVYLGLPFDRSSGLAGAEKGPEAIHHILDTQIEFYEPITETTPRNNAVIAYEEIKKLNECSAETMVKRVYNRHQKIANMGNPFIVGLGGDHSVSIGIFKSIAKTCSELGKQLPTILQIDAHFDLRESDEDFRKDPVGIYAHCSVMRRAAELGFPSVPVGIRSYSREEFEYACAHRDQIMPFRWNPDSTHPHHTPAPETIVDCIQTKDVYLTIDIDGIDPSHMPATGTPVQNGLSWSYTIELLKKLFKARNVIGMDIVEVAPPLGMTNITAYGAAQLTYMCIALHQRTKS